MKIFFLLTITLLMLNLLLIPSMVHAQQESTTSAIIEIYPSRINPDSFMYPLKRAVEKIRLSLAGSASNKAELEKQFIDERFKELTYVAKKQKYAIFEQTASRYQTQVGTFIASYPEVSIGTKKEDYLKILRSYQKQYENDYAYWSFLTSSIELSEKLK